jgi:hypothetical protein
LHFVARLCACGAIALALGLAALGLAAAGASADPRLPAKAAAPPPTGPLQIVVSIASQRLFLYDRDRLIETTTVSTGVGEFPTPTGVFSIIDKEAEHYSNIYRGASMPFMQRLTMSGVALHSGLVTGRPASHGCIRLPHAFAMRLFALTRLGTRVIVARDAPVPFAIAHPGLSALSARVALPPDAPGSGLEDVALASGQHIARAAADARVGPATAARRDALAAMGITVLVSRAEGRLFVRQGFVPLFDAPATFREPERALGTHVFTVLDADETGGGLRWIAVSPGAGNAGGTVTERAGRRNGAGPEPGPEPVAMPVAHTTVTAADALDRLQLPQAAVDRIGALLAPGATLIVTDHGLNRETRPYGTDFVILMR